MDEGHHLIADVAIVLLLHPGAMERVRVLIEERLMGHGGNGEDLDLPGLDEGRQGADHALPLMLPLIAAAGGEHQHRQAVMSVDDERHVVADPRRIPSVIFLLHARHYARALDRPFWSDIDCRSHGSANRRVESLSSAG
jgi:hypothetical protein